MSDNRSEFEKLYHSLSSTLGVVVVGAGVGIGANTAIFAFQDPFSIPAMLAVSGGLSALAGVIVSEWYDTSSFLYRNYEVELVEKEPEDDN